MSEPSIDQPFFIRRHDKTARVTDFANNTPVDAKVMRLAIATECCADGSTDSSLANDVAQAVRCTRDVNLIGGEPGSNFFPQYSMTDLDGEYRLLWDGAFASYDPNTGTGAPLPEASRVSNRFLIRVKSQ